MVIFFICPILSFPLLLYYSSLRRRWAYTLLAIFMGLCAMLWPPTGDLYRHNMMYFDFVEMDKSQFLDFIKIRFDFLLYTISFLFAKLGVPFEFIRFFFIFTTYKLTFRVYEDYSWQSAESNNTKKIVFYIFYFSVLFFTTVQGLRFGFATSLLAFGAYQYLAKNRRIGLLYVFASCITHFSVIPVAMVLFIVKLGLKITKIWIVTLSILCLLCFNASVFQLIIDILPINATTHAVLSAYVTGYWGGEFLEDHSLKYQISKYLGHIMMYPLLYLTFKNTSHQPYSQFGKILIVFVCACFAISDTLYFRIAILFIPIGLYLSFCKKSSRHSILLLLICSFISFTSQIYSFRRELTLSREYKLFYPAPLVFNTSFSEEWVNQNIYEDGQGKSLKY